MFRQKNKIVLFIISIILLFSFICIPVSALDVNNIDYSFEIQTPVVTSNSGYIELITENWGSILFYFTATMNSAMYKDHSADFSFYAYINSGNELCIDSNPKTDANEDIFVNVTGFYVTPQGWTNWMSSELTEAGTTIPIRMWLGNSGKILYARGYNVELANLGVSSNFPSFIYGTDDRLFNKLDYITRLLEQNSQGFNSIVDNANNNANNIQQNQDKNTQEIINNQNQLQQQEKDETQNQGQDSIDDVSGSIEDKSAGFISAISNLVGSMSYNGTACAWSFPALKLPAIDGVMPEYQLTEEQPIDFEFWVNKIPADILVLVRSLLTIALIGYCFKELYGTISYVLTLKGGGNNE